MADTKTKLLDVAESQFAENGIGGTSLRNIISKAEVNLASIHYHFGSKEALVQAVIRRRIEPLNQIRMQRLDALEEQFRDTLIPLEDLIRAFIEPPLRMKIANKRLHKIFYKLFGQIISNSETNKITEFIADLFEEVGRRYFNAFANALPHLNEKDILWRIRFTIGSIHAVMMPPPLPKHVAEHIHDPDDVDEILHHIIPFLVAGLSAPSFVKSNGEQ